MYNTKSVGDLGEEFAAQILTLKGYRVLEKNYRCRTGEIDIIAERDNEIIFVEVKTRQTARFGTPAESITREKQRHIRNTASHYMCCQGKERHEMSFHVMEIMVNQIENAF